VKKKLIFLLILVAFLGIAYRIQSSKDVPVESIEKSIAKELKSQKLNKCVDQDLVHFIEIDPSSTKGYIYYKSPEALSVDELLIVKASDRNKLNNLRDSVDKRIQSQLKIFEGYGPKQVAALKNALIIQKGTYLLYYVGDDGQKIEEVFRNAVQ
jgi:hypothetical protein